MRKFVALLAVLFGVAACGKPAPYWSRSCLASHAEMRLQPVPLPGEIRVAGMAYRLTNVCDEYSDWVCVVPDGAAGTCEAA